jgi:hypothetical protein
VSFESIARKYDAAQAQRALQNGALKANKELMALQRAAAAFEHPPLTSDDYFMFWKTERQRTKSAVEKYWNGLPQEIKELMHEMRKS